MKRAHGVVKGVFVARLNIYTTKGRKMAGKGQSREASILIGSFDKAEVSSGGVNGVYDMRLVRSMTNVTYFVRRTASSYARCIVDYASFLRSQRTQRTI